MQFWKPVATLVLACGISCSIAQAQIITQWNFNSPVPDANTATGSDVPSIGTGTISTIGLTQSFTFASGSASGGSSDPAGTNDNSGYQTTGYPAPQTGNETAGIAVLTSTVGFSNITVSWDQRHSNSASRFVAFYYTTDGTNFTRLALSALNSNPGTTPSGGNPASTAGGYGANGTFSAFDETVTGAGDDWFNGRSVNLSGIAGVDNNPNFGFQIVASFDAGDNYLGSGSTAYATTGTWRFDMITVSAAAVPEPSAYALCLVTLAGVGVVRYRKKLWNRKQVA